MSGMINIRAGSGLGDALYLRPIAEALHARVAANGQAVTACTDYPDVFAGSAVATMPFRRDNIDRVAHYTAGKNNPATTQFADMCAMAQLPEPRLAFAWQVKNPALLARVQTHARGRPVVLAHGGRAPMNRTDGFGAELLPAKAAFDAVLAELADCCIVGIGRDTPVYRLPVELDLNGATSVTDLIDLASACDAMVAQCSFAVPLAEIFDRPLLAVWSARGLEASHPYVRSIVPGKILSKKSSHCVMDDEPPARLRERVHAFRDF